MQNPIYLYIMYINYHNNRKYSLGTDLFWNQILICRSVRQSWWAISIRLRRVR